MAASDRIINGNTIAADIRNELKAEIEQIKQQGLEAPGLAVILVGDRTDSATYVRMKEKACQEVGINSSIIKMPATSTQEEIIAKGTTEKLPKLSPALPALLTRLRLPLFDNLVQELNADPTVHGILVQVPLPEHVNENAVLDVISNDKDVDGFHALNIGTRNLTN